MTADFSKLKARLNAIEKKAGGGSGWPGILDKEGRLTVAFWVRLLQFKGGPAKDPNVYFSRLEKRFLTSDEKKSWPLAAGGEWQMWEKVFCEGHVWEEPLYNPNAPKCTCVLCKREKEEEHDGDF